MQDRTARGQVVSSLLLPVPMIAAITLGLLVGPHRVLSLVFLVVVMTVAVYVRRWGPRGFAWGMVASNGAFLGFFLHAQIGLVRVVRWATHRNAARREPLPLAAGAPTCRTTTAPDPMNPETPCAPAWP